MLKAKAEIKGRKTLVLGLSYRNLDKLRDQPLDTYILVKKDEMDLPFDIIIISGKTERDIEDFLLQGTNQ